LTAEAPAMTTALAHAEPHAPSGHAQRGISNPILGMLLFITSEVMFFSGLFAAYFATRAANQPWPPEPFTHILDPLGPIIIATIILIASSFTCQFAVWSIFDYALLFSEGMTMGSGPFGTTYFTLTGFHGAHVFGGVLMLGVILYRGMSGQFSAKHHDAVEAVSLYWHFVDVVWILLFSILYLL
jgi:cytochrome c oxidase subunit 3